MLQLFLHIRHAGYVTLLVQAYNVYIFQFMSFSLVQELENRFKFSLYLYLLQMQVRIAQPSDNVNVNRFIQKRICRNISTQKKDFSFPLFA